MYLSGKSVVTRGVKTTPNWVVKGSNMWHGLVFHFVVSCNLNTQSFYLIVCC